MAEILSQSRWFWSLLAVTVGGEFLVPYLLSFRDPAYISGTMAVSVLGRKGGPVSRAYRGWLLWLGAFLLATAGVYYTMAAPVSFPLAVWQFCSIALFAVGAGILAALFPTGLEKDLSDRHAMVHGVASALGFFALLFFPLCGGLLALAEGGFTGALPRLAAWILALLFFVLFILADKESFRNTWIAREGLWEQLCLGAMYLPFLLDAYAGLTA